jgi:hypothetical protein
VENKANCRGRDSFVTVRPGLIGTGEKPTTGAQGTKGRCAKRSQFADTVRFAPNHCHETMNPYSVPAGMW